jgi:hypothetical protein
MAAANAQNHGSVNGTRSPPTADRATQPATGPGPARPPPRPSRSRMPPRQAPKAAQARRLYISPHTVNTHLRHVCAKLGVPDRVTLAAVVHHSIE